MNDALRCWRPLRRWPAGVLSILFAFGCAAEGLKQDVADNTAVPRQSTAISAHVSKPPVATRDRLSRSTVDLPRQLLPNGMTQLKLGQRFAHAPVARRTADGKLEVECVDRASALDHALRGAP